MADAFISYSRQDRGRVEQIAVSLQAEGFSVWWDPEILPGSAFSDVIDKQLAAASFVLVVWSQASIESRWVKEEAADALQRDVLIPIFIDNVPLPRGFKLVQAEDLTGWRGELEAEGWRRVVHRARLLTGRLDDPSSEAEHAPISGAVTSAFAGLLSAARAANGFASMIYMDHARSHSNAFERRDLYDLRDFAEKLAAILAIGSPQVSSAAERLRLACDEARNAHMASVGPSFYFPASRSQMTRDMGTYEKLAFARNSGWADFLKEFR